MASKTDTEDNSRRTTSVPVTTMEDVPVLSEYERADLVASLNDAEARVKAGKAVDYDSKTVRKRLIGIYQQRKP